MKGKKGQAFLANFLVMVIVGMLLYIATDNFISPLITQYGATQGVGTRLLLKMIIPVIYFVYVLILFKMVNRGDSDTSP